MAQAQTAIAENKKPTMVTFPQLAKLGYISDRAARRLAAEGRFPTIQVGNRKYVNLDVFKRYLNGEQSAER